MTHIDLFSGIGGFSLAFDNIFHEQKNIHIFCEIDPFCQAVLKMHWPDAEIVGDIISFTNTRGEKQCGIPNEFAGKKVSATGFKDKSFLLTGGFPCQPFSQAGRRKGTSDDRHLWPEMLRVIQLTQPQWVIAENVRGLLTIGGGMVFEQVCTDLESAGYEVQPIIIPAVSVNAPHRRDRVWFIAHSTSERKPGRTGKERGNDKRIMEQEKCKGCKIRGQGQGCSCVNNTNAISTGLEGRREERSRQRRQLNRAGGHERSSWEKNWLEVATRLCRVDDGLPRRMDRNPRLKALGNAIVPQVAEEIMKSIKQINDRNHTACSCRHESKGMEVV